MEDSPDLNLNLGESLVDKKQKKLKIIAISIAFSLILLIIITVVIIVSLQKDENEEEEKKGNDTPFTKLLTDSQIHKPLSSNLMSEIIQLKNGLQAILISEKNTTASSIDIETTYGSCLDIIGGLAHFSEHMAYRGGKNFPEGSFSKGFNYIGVSKDAFTTMESTNYYFYTKTGVKYETFINILADSLSNPTLNPEIFKREINIVNSEFLMSNITDIYILNNILYSLTNENHPLHNAFSVGNNESLNSMSVNDMEKHLKAYFQQAYNPKNLVVLLRSNKSLEELENLTLKYFNYEIKITETVGNKERDEIRKKLKEERLFKKENGGKFLKYFSKVAHNANTTNYYNLLSLSFGINSLEYTDGFNPIDFILFLLNRVPNSSLHNYLFSKDYIYLFTNKIWVQFFERETGFIHIYVLLTKNGINHIEEVIKVIFQYLNLIKNSVDEIEKEHFPNYQKYKFNQFNYKYKENEDYNSVNRQIIINMKKHGMENIFKNDVPEKFNKDLFVKFMEDFIHIENTIISLNSNIDMGEIAFFDNYTTKYLEYYGNEFNITNLKPDFIETLKQYPVDESLTDLIKLRSINEYFTNISKPTEPCYYKSNEECVTKKEYNPLMDKNYKKERCDNDDTYLCYFANDRSLNMPKVKIILKIKSKTDEALTPQNKLYFNALYLSPILSDYFSDFLEDDNNDLSISYETGTEEFIIVIDTYKDVSKNIFNKVIDRFLTVCDQETFDRLIKHDIFEIYTQMGESTLKLEEINPGAILDLIEYGITDKYPYQANNDLRILEQFNFATVQIFFNLFVNSFIGNTKLYLIGDLDENLISELSQIVKEKIPLNVVNSFDNNLKEKLDLVTIFKEQENKYIFPEKKDELILFNINKDIKGSNILNKFSSFLSNDKNAIPQNTVVNYIYSNDNIYEKHSFTGIFYALNLSTIPSMDLLNIFIFSIEEKVNKELRLKLGLGYHCLMKYINSITQTPYLFFYVQGAMKTPIQVQDDINAVIKDILYSYEPEDFDSIIQNYLDYFNILKNENTFSSRVNAFIKDDKEKDNKTFDFNINNAEVTFRQIAEIMKTYFENPIRIGVFEYANYIDKDFIESEIKERKNEVYLFNKNLTVNYTHDINYFR